ncbi:MAG: hypothetical protein M3460_28370 [Actinomycetota bacterium]|nr:hypothetical protein [Actinomycetota bacterium]
MIGDVARYRALRLKVEHGILETTHGEVTIERLPPSSSGELVASIVNKTQTSAGLTGEFADLYPLAYAYLKQNCFGEVVDLDADTIRMFLANPSHQENIATFLGRHLGELTVEHQPLELETAPTLLSLSKTLPFHWPRQHTVCNKTVFNYVATFKSL